MKHTKDIEMTQARAKLDETWLVTYHLPFLALSPAAQNHQYTLYLAGYKTLRIRLRLFCQPVFTNFTGILEPLIVKCKTFIIYSRGMDVIEQKLNLVWYR